MAGRTLTLKVKTEVSGLDQLDKIGTKVANFGRKMTTHVTLPLLAAGGAAFKFASDIEESTNKAAEVFGDAVGRIDREATNLNDIIDEATFRNVAGTFGALLQNMGLTDKASADLSVRWIKLAEDMASFHNVDLDQALNAIRAGISGEFEPLKKFGVFLNEATIKQKALEQGLWDGTGAIDASTRAIIVNQELFKQQSSVLGDVNRTIDDAANSTRNLWSNFMDTAGALGKELLPLGTDLLKMVNGWVIGFKRLSPETKGLILQVGAVVAATGPLLFVFGKVANSVKFFVGAGKLIHAAWLNIPTLLGFVDLAVSKMGLAFHALLGPLGIATGLIALFAAGFATDFLGMRTRFEKDMEDIGRTIDNFALDFGDMGDTVHRLAEQTGVDFQSMKDEIKDAMEESGTSFDEVVERIEAGLSATGEALAQSSSIAHEWSQDQKAAYAAMNTAVSESMDLAVGDVMAGADGMAEEIGAAPGKMADALLANQFELTGPDGAIAELVDFMDKAISPIQEKWNARAFLSSQEYKDGLNSGIPSVVLKAEELAAEAHAVLDNPDYYGVGAGAGYSFGAGLVDPAVINFVSNSAARLAAAARGIFPSSEPKDPNSPFRGITKGFGFGEILGKGILTGASAVQDAMRLLAGGGVGMPTIGRLSPVLAGSSGGGGTVVNHNYYLNWDGEPPQGRTEAEIAGNLKRLSAMWER